MKIRGEILSSVLTIKHLSTFLRTKLPAHLTCDTVCIVAEDQVSHVQSQHYKLLDAWKTCLLRKFPQDIDERERPTCDCDPGFIFVQLSRSFMNQVQRKDNKGNSTYAERSVFEDQYTRYK
ncbi:uncharacterized protein LOC143227414 [Tachypleus tridentatus]|uniref:uncharacterized protein LOC143227414 n=1 Tax=Tachypleus tridentatus TaxID=6853 RepID=UPI003FD512B7